MNRNSLLEISGRVMHQLVRMTLNKGNDNAMMQELNFDGMNSEGRNFVERVQAFGMSTVPLPRDEQQGQQSGGGGGGGSGGVGGSGEQPKGPAAEGIAAFIGGQRNHPVVIAIDDRRHRPLGLKPGESFQYDHQGQGTLIREAATYIMSLDDDGSGQSPGGKMLKDGSGQSQKKERFVSLRHVQKKKQDRSKGGSPAANLKTWRDAGHDISRFSAEERAQAERAPNHEDYKHEGDTVNTEVRANKSKVEFRTGDTAVGHYDKDAKEWQLTSSGDDSKSVKVTDNHAHIKIGGNSIFVDSGGCWSTQPIQIKGDPTAVRGDGPTWMERIEQLEARVKQLEASHGR